MAHSILVPPLGQTTDTVVFSTWHKQVGDVVQIGDLLFAIETDKATLDIEAQASGVLRAITAQPGDEVAVLSVIGVIAATNEQLQTQEKASVSANVIQTPTARAVEQPQAEIPAVREKASERFFISPRARRTADAQKVDWRSVRGSGPAGAVVERDVLRIVQDRSQTAQPQPTFTAASVPASAQSSVASWVSATVDLSALLLLVQRMVKRGYAVTLDDLIILLALRSLQEQPLVDSSAAEVTLGVLQITPADVLMQWLRLPVNARVADVHQALQNSVPAVPPSRIGETGSAALLYANLDNHRLDQMSGISGAVDTPFVQLGRMRKQVDGTMLAQVSLSLPNQPIGVVRATAFMTALVKYLEDPDLLF